MNINGPYTTKRPLYLVTGPCSLPVHGRAGAPSPWDHIHRATVAEFFAYEDVWCWLTTQHWVWADGDAVVTPYHVVIRSGQTVTVTKASGLAPAMREVGLDYSDFEIRDLSQAGTIYCESCAAQRPERGSVTIEGQMSLCSECAMLPVAA